MDTNDANPPPPPAAPGPPPQPPPLPTDGLEAPGAANPVVGSPPGKTRRLDAIRFATAALCFGLLFLGTIWRFYDLDYPRTFSFDEHHFVSNARNYMQHKADWNDHPPLGKLVLIPAMKAFGDRGLGWRLSSAVLGLAMVVLMGLAVAKLFDDRRAGLLAAAFLAIDGFFICYARSALIDNPLTAFMYAALALMLYARSLRWFAAAAICVGLAVASKWTGVCVLLLAPLLLRRAHKSIWHTAWMFAVAALVYVAIGAFALHTTRQPIAFAGMMRSNWQLLQHHAGFTVWDNAASSKWYTWPLLIHPIVTHYERVGFNVVRATSTIGNLLLWYATTVTMVLALIELGRAGYRWLRHRVPVTAARWSDGLALLGMAALMLPFILTHRQSYIFHYLGAYGIGLGLLAARLTRLEKRAAVAVLGFVVAATVVSMLYLPLATGAPQSLHAFHMRLPFPGWR